MSTPGAVVMTTDYHTAGEPFRIVTAGAPVLPGDTVADRRTRAMDSDPASPGSAQYVRRLLCHEPRGHDDMYGCFVVPPDDAGADLGVLFWHKDGFSTACGHGTIALATWAAQTGAVDVAPDGTTEVRIDVPSGRVTALVRCADGAIADVTFRNVPSYVLHRGASVSTSMGDVAVDVSFGGAVYASAPASAVGLAVRRGNVAALTALGREIKWAVQDAGLAEHPADARLSGCYGAMLYDDFGDAGPDGAGPAGPYQRSMTVFADGEVDRSPCGSGTSARMALLHADGRLPPGTVFTHDSIIDTRFTATAGKSVTAAGRQAVITDITAMAFRTGEHRFVVDPRDQLATGFTLR
jgi:proline racemase/trans-L-3-hydroxyproline dehydratase